MSQTFQKILELVARRDVLVSNQGENNEWPSSHQTDSRRDNMQLKLRFP